jgi:hypothetical protein
MIYNYRNIPNIVFPIYKLHTDNVSLGDGILFIEGEILDDTNMPGESLGRRRLQTPFGGLYKLPKGSYDLDYLFKYKHFIDSAGKVFTYEKTSRQDLKHYKLKRVEKKDIKSLLWFFDIPFPIEATRPPDERYPFARILCLNGHPWFVYDFTLEKGKDTKRKI